MINFLNPAGVFITVSLMVGLPCHAQNLVPNPDFEIHTQCPENLNNIAHAVPWENANKGTADYLNTCSTGNAGVPVNAEGVQWPLSGEAYSGIITRNAGGFREYLRAPLLAPLEAGVAYEVSFYVSPGEPSCRTKPLGALFTVDPPYEDDYLFLDYTPQIEVNGDYLGDYDDWTLISRCFVAEGGERYITIGNFHDNDECPPEPHCGPFGLGESAYYYVDLVSVEAMPLSESSLPMDPIMACDSFVIDPGQAENYQWNDGTTNPTLTVKKSGMYYVTLSNACDFRYSEVDVTIVTSPPPVRLPNDTTLCEGEVLAISLDPDAGDYLWQDGSTNYNYIISHDGMYTVILDDSCDVTMDTINVKFLHPSDDLLSEEICNPHARIYIPNVFSPNGDNINDTWEVMIDPDLRVTAINCKVFDRWGGVVYQSTSLPIAWDPGYRSRSAQPGVYTYVLELNFLTQSQKEARTLRGNLTLLR